jgi:8-oxo-dGTP diphosphatase
VLPNIRIPHPLEWFSIEPWKRNMADYQLPTALVTADIVIFTVRGGHLEILLIERGGEPFRGCWALPGGFVEHDEDIDVAACRELEEETGVKGLALEQLRAFGEPNRDPRGRVVTIAYYTLVPAGQLAPRAADDAARAEWFDADKLPSLAFDHAGIVALARKRLGSELERTARAAPFLPKAFTLADLRALHELVLGEPIEPRGFRKRLIALEVVEPTGKVVKREGRAVRLYRFKRPGRA